MTKDMIGYGERLKHFYVSQRLNNGQWDGYRERLKHLCFATFET